MGLLRKLYQIVVGTTPTPASVKSDFEIVSGVSVSSALVRQYAFCQPRVLDLFEEARASILPVIESEETHQLFDRLVIRFAAYVMDLPASETHHHSEPWGLLVHSLETARFAVERAKDQEIDPLVTPQLSAWRYAALLLGLTHDVGKINDVWVRADDEQWEPFNEPLIAFYQRHGRNVRVEHRTDRDSGDHVGIGPLFFDRILTPEIIQRVRPILAEALAGRSALARTFLRHVWAADAESRAEKEETPQPVPAQEPGPAPIPEPKPIISPIDPKQFSRDLREEILSGNIPRNAARTGTIFITPEWSYLVVPNAFKPLKARGYPDAAEPGAIYPMLKALISVRIAWEKPIVWQSTKNHHSIFKIKTPPGAPAMLNVIACHTDLLFTQEELGKLGFWTHPIEHMGDGGEIPPQGQTEKNDANGE